ncbi:MAG: PEP-CTERM sorting domain-containing protein [Pseudomonadota bacterium]
MLTVGEPPAVPTASYPPANPVIFPTPFFNAPPPIIVPPPVIPPCDDIPDNDIPDCDGPPPTPVPEPGILVILFTGLAATMIATRKRWLRA